MLTLHDHGDVCLLAHSWTLSHNVLPHSACCTNMHLQELCVWNASADNDNAATDVLGDKAQALLASYHRFTDVLSAVQEIRHAHSKITDLVRTHGEEHMADRMGPACVVDCP